HPPHSRRRSLQRAIRLRWIQIYPLLSARDDRRDLKALPFLGTSPHHRWDFESTAAGPVFYLTHCASPPRQNQPVKAKDARYQHPADRAWLIINASDPADCGHAQQQVTARQIAPSAVDWLSDQYACSLPHQEEVILNETLMG